MAMTRVDGNDSSNEVKRQDEQRRIEEQQRKRAQETGQEFSKLVAQKKEVAGKELRKDARGKNESSKQQTDVAQRHSANAALLARRGVDNNALQAKLADHGQQNLQTTKQAQTSRTDDMRDTQRSTGEANQQVERRQDNNDRLAAISRDDRRGGHGGGDGEMGSGAGGGGANDQGYGAQGQATPQAATGVQGAASAPTDGAAGAAKLPPHILEMLIKRVMVGVNPQGFGEFHIEFKEDVLAGARLKVTAEHGNVVARFESERADVRKRVKQAEPELAKALEARGLRLQRLEVVGV
jgi:hypothetical protein